MLTVEAVSAIRKLGKIRDRCTEDSEKDYWASLIWKFVFDWASYNRGQAYE